MHTEGVTSLSVLDSQKNVIGNISHVDVRVRIVLSPLCDNLLPFYLTPTAAYGYVGSAAP